MRGPLDVRSFRTILGLSRVGFSQLIGVDTRTVVRWEMGEVAPTGAAAAVLLGLTTALANDEGDTVRTLLRQAASIGGLAYLLITLLEQATKAGR